MTDILSRQSALWCDQYALTMAQALWADGRHDRTAVFHAFIRKTPFAGGYLLTGGQNIVRDWLARHWRFTEDDLAQLKSKKIFHDNFLTLLQNAQLELDIDCMLEGEIAFADEPIYRVRGPLWQCLLVEAGILNTLNSQSLIATLAARMVYAAGDKPVFEMGLRRSQGVDGLTASRAAWLGGVMGTANMLAEQHYNMPAMGTMAHAYVMAYDHEQDAFDNFARVYGDDSVFLVDSYNTMTGVEHVIKTARAKNIYPKAIRIDSGDLAYFSSTARTLLDQNGFHNTKIIASNDLDETTILSLIAQGAKIDAYGIGTHLVTAAAQPSLGGVYKLGAIADDAGVLKPVIKISEEPGKTTIPGALTVVRYVDDSGIFAGDTILDAAQTDTLIHDGRLTRDIASRRLHDPYPLRVFKAGTRAYMPLQPLFRQGQPVTSGETVTAARARAAAQLEKLDTSHRRQLNPHRYGVGLEDEIFTRRRQMIQDKKANE
jgi:nicotinate phosphoribosyltransferase